MNGMLTIHCIRAHTDYSHLDFAYLIQRESGRFNRIVSPLLPFEILHNLLLFFIFTKDLDFFPSVFVIEFIHSHLEFFNAMIIISIYSTSLPGCFLP